MSHNLINIHICELASCTLIGFLLNFAAIENINDFITHNATLSTQTRRRWSPALRLVQIKVDVMTQRGQLGHLLASTLILLANQVPVLKRDVKAAMFVHYVPRYDTSGFAALFSFK